MEPRPVSAGAAETVRIMTLAEANDLGNVHGGVIMREVRQDRRTRMGSWHPPAPSDDGA